MRGSWEDGEDGSIKGEEGGANVDGNIAHVRGGVM